MSVAGRSVRVRDVDYQVLDFIGKGGGGTVYRVRSSTTGTIFALKHIHEPRTFKHHLHVVIGKKPLLGIGCFFLRRDNFMACVKEIAVLRRLIGRPNVIQLKKKHTNQVVVFDRPRRANGVSKFGRFRG